MRRKHIYTLALEQIQREILSGKHEWAVERLTEFKEIGRGVFRRVGTHTVPDEIFHKMALDRALWG